MLRIQPFGVLGIQMTRDKQEVIRGDDPSCLASCCIVDPAGLHHIQPPGGPYGAGGAARAVYSWLGISQSFQFSKEVVEGVKATGHAKYKHYHRFRYGVMDKHVIHAVGPDLRNIARDFDAVTEPLIEAYKNIFLEFARSERQLLRLLPVSSGIFAGDHKEDMPKMTIYCMKKGFHGLSKGEQQSLQGRDLHLCIFLEKELEEYEKAAAKEKVHNPRTENSIGVYHAFEEVKPEILVDLGTDVSNDLAVTEAVDGMRAKWNSTESERITLLRTSGRSPARSFSRSSDRYHTPHKPNQKQWSSKSEPRNTTRRSPASSSALVGRVNHHGKPTKKLYDVAARPVRN
jgi:O-acetyl-ADP-ribose deacetylase (regulator of RNase III)